MILKRRHFLAYVIKMFSQIVEKDQQKPKYGSTAKNLNLTITSNQLWKTLLCSLFSKISGRWCCQMNESKENQLITNLQNQTMKICPDNIINDLTW